MENQNLSHESARKPQILRESEFYGGCIRVKISVKNTSSLVITHVALELDSDDRILHFDRCEPEYPQKNGKIILDTIDANTDRTIAFYLDPLICAKEGTDINCRVNFKYADGTPDTVHMEKLKIQVVCPIFKTEYDINIGRLKELIKELQSHDSKVYNIPKSIDTTESLKTCRNVIQQHDVRHIKTFKTTDDKTYECWYFGKTKVTKKDLVIKCAIRGDNGSIEIFVAGNDPKDITGLLAEIGRNLTKEFEKIGKVQPVFNIVFKRSLIKDSNLLSHCDLNGKCDVNVVFEDCELKGSNVASWNKEDKERQVKQSEPERTSYKKFFAVPMVIVILFLGYWAVAPGTTKAPEKMISAPISNIETTISPTESQITAQQSKYWTASAQRLNVVTLAFNNNVNAAAASGLEGTGQGQGFENGYYYVLDWQENKLVAINGKMGKFAKLVIEHGLNSSDKKSVVEGETWDIGDGWALTAQSIDARASPKQARLVLTKGNTNKTYVVTTGQIITYVENSIFGESDVPIFVTYVDSMYAGATKDMMQLRYTWAIDPSGMMEIRKGDILNNFEVVTIDNINKRIEVKPYIEPTASQNPSTPATFANSIGIEFVQIPAGEFDMGSPANEKERFSNEDPVHHVKISKAFYMGKYEVTQKQWRDVMGNNPSNFNGDNLPVEQVSWNDVQAFVKKLNQNEGIDKYRLPSEAEWEYAARAGTTTRYSFGDDESKLGEYAWYDGNSGGTTHEVGQKKPNPWGLYDTHGNVWEWVQDIWHDSYNGAPTDGSAWEGDGSARVIRSGNYYGVATWYQRSAVRNGDYPARSGPGLGFRLLKDI